MLKKRNRLIFMWRGQYMKMANYLLENVGIEGDIRLVSDDAVELRGHENVRFLSTNWEELPVAITDQLRFIGFFPIIVSGNFTR